MIAHAIGCNNLNSCSPLPGYRFEAEQGATDQVDTTCHLRLVPMGRASPCSGQPHSSSYRNRLEELAAGGSTADCAPGSQRHAHTIVSLGFPRESGRRLSRRDDMATAYGCSDSSDRAPKGRQGDYAPYERQRQRTRDGQGGALVQSLIAGSIVLRYLVGRTGRARADSNSRQFCREMEAQH